MRTITYIPNLPRGVSLDNLVIQDNHDALFFMDFNDFYPNIRSGEFDTEKGYRQNGATMIGATVSSITPKMTFTVQAFLSADKQHPIASVLDELKEKLGAVLSPLRPARMIYESNSVTSKSVGGFELTVRPSASPTFGDVNWLTGTMEVSVDFVAESAFWRSATEFSAKLGMTYNGLTMPFVIPFTLADVSKVVEANVLNISSATVYPRIVFSNNLNAITVTNSTNGSTITIDREIHRGQRLVVTTEPFRESAILQEYNGVEWVDLGNALHYITADSTERFYLSPGINSIRSSAVRSGNGPAVEVLWRVPFDTV